MGSQVVHAARREVRLAATAITQRETCNLQSESRRLRQRRGRRKPRVSRRHRGVPRRSNQGRPPYGHTHRHFRNKIAADGAMMPGNAAECGDPASRVAVFREKRCKSGSAVFLTTRLRPAGRPIFSFSDGPRQSRSGRSSAKFSNSTGTCLAPAAADFYNLARRTRFYVTVYDSSVCNSQFHRLARQARTLVC
jgi:hypothetical protein